ncbi:MAG: HAMP domain-containing sensor histidine kinase [Gammaproteobacteria bacterium]|nr:HAMP domain-containing sensor histidine kinase [Gammaproteobacteria bacterium]
MKRPIRVSLRTVLIGINLTVLLLPVAGIVLMRLYESALVRQTESALIAQAAFVAAFYRSLVVEQGTRPLETISREFRDLDGQWFDGRWSPRPPTLDLASSPVLPPFPDGQPGQPARAFAQQVGERLMPVLKDAQLVTLAGIRVVDPWGTIIASTGDDVGLNIAEGDEIAAALLGEPSSRLRRKSEVVEVTALNSISRSGGVRVFVAAPIVLGGRLIGAVMLSRTPPSIVQALYAKRWLLLQALGLLLVLVLVMSLLTFRFIARPIARLADQASRISAGETSALNDESPADVLGSRTVEIARLQDAITDMAATLEQRANYLQDFSRHVSHEFKTPIAGIRGAIEVLQDHDSDMTGEQHARFLHNIAADAERLHRLTERLMELTRAEIRTSACEPFKLTDVVRETVNTFSQQVVFNTQGVNAEAHALGQPDVLNAVLEILFENAIQHEACEVTVWTRLAPGIVELFVQDNGTGIPSSNRTKVFDAFFTTQRDRGGTGLGLTIATALLKQSQGELRLASENGPTTFRLTLGQSQGTPATRR